MANVTDKSILTAAGKALLAQLNAEEKALVIDKMIFANVPNRPEYPQPDDVVPSNNVVHEAAVEQRGRLSVDSVIYSTTLTSQEGPFEFNWTGAYCSEYGVLVTIDHHALTPKTVDEPGVSGNTLVRSVVLEYKDIAEITNITVDASSWQYNATPRMKKMDDDVAQAIIDQNGKDWFIEDGFLVTPQASAFNIKAGAGYVSGNRVTLEFDRNVQVPNKPSFIYVDAHREGTPTGEQITLFDFVVTAQEKDDYTDTNGVKHFVCKIAQVLGDGSVSDLRPEGESADKKWVQSRDRTANILYLSDYGAQGNGVTDDYDAITRAIADTNPYPLETTDVNEIFEILNNRPTVIMMSGLHRHTKRIHIPAGVTFSHPGQAYFTTNVNLGLFYDPVDKDTAGVSSLVYKKHDDGVYRIYGDIYNIPTGYDFDAGDYISATKSVDLDFNVITAPGVTVGLFWLGAAGCSSSRLSIGENGKGDLARLPKVGMVMSSCWGSYHEKPKILGRNQGLVLIGANGGSVFDTPYIDRNGSDGNDLSKMVYRVDFDKDGSVGITTIGTTSVLILSPIVEHWMFPHVIGDDSDIKLIKPHIESYNGRLKHSYVVKRSRMEVDGVSISSAPQPQADPESSIFHLVDCEDGVHEVFAYGNFPTLGYRMVTGYNSGKVLNVTDIGRPQIQFGALGDVELIGSISDRMTERWIQIDPVNGDDENWGLHSTRPVKTLSAALKRADLFDSTKIQIINHPLQTDEVVSLKNDLSIYGKQFEFTGNGHFSVSQTDVKVRIYCEGFLSGDVSPFWLSNGGEVAVSMASAYAFGGAYAPILFDGVGVANLVINNADVSTFTRYAHTSQSGVGQLSVYIKSPNRNKNADSEPAVGNVSVIASKFED